MGWFCIMEMVRLWSWFGKGEAVLTDRPLLDGESVKDGGWGREEAASVDFGGFWGFW